MKPAALTPGTRVERARPVLRHARAAEVPQERPRRERGGARRRAASRHEPADVALHAGGGGRAPVAAPRRCRARRTRWRGLPTSSAQTSHQRASRSRPSATASTVAGFAALPTLTRANRSGSILFVNGRPVRDKLLIGVVRGAYADYLPRDRHPMVALFVDASSARGRRQRASRQGRGALPRRRLVRAR